MEAARVPQTASVDEIKKITGNLSLTSPSSMVSSTMFWNGIDVAINISSHLLNMRVEARAVCLNLNCQASLFTYYVCIFAYGNVSCLCILSPLLFPFSL